MKHSFTDQQLTDAYEAALKEGPCGNTPADYMRAVVNHLPEPATDEWRECGFNDFRPTDKRVKALFIGGSIIEGTPDRRNGEHVFLVDGPVIHSYDDAKFYRIPAPVVAPDPEEHPVIIVDTNYGGLKGRHPFVWDGEMYAAVSGPIKHANPESITDWSPAKVVEDDR